MDINCCFNKVGLGLMYIRYYGVFYLTVLVNVYYDFIQDVLLSFGHGPPSQIGLLVGW